MRIHSTITSLTELVLIAVMAAIGAYAFLASSAYNAVKSYGAAHHIGFMPGLLGKNDALVPFFLPMS